MWYEGAGVQSLDLDLHGGLVRPLDAVQVDESPDVLATVEEPLKAL